MASIEATLADEAEALIAEARDLLLKVGGSQPAAMDEAERHIALWVAIRDVCASLGLRHPFFDTPTIWDWHGLCLGWGTSTSPQQERIDERAGPAFTAIAAVRERAARGDTFPFEAHYYCVSETNIPVADYLDELREQSHADKIKKRIAMLNSLTRDRPFLARPSGAALDGKYGDGFYELRVEIDVQHRIIYRPYGQVFVLLHAFPKSGDKVPETDKKTAFMRWKDMLDRINTEPDPIGKRAP